MDPETEKIIKEQMKKIPEEVRKLLADPKLNDKFLIVGKKYGMNIEQMGIFQTETMLMMLGLTHPDKYSEELKNRLKISEEKVDSIVVDVNQEILSGIREKLKEAYEESSDGSGEGEGEEKLTEIDEAEIKLTPLNTEEDTKNAQVLSKAGISFVEPSPIPNPNNGKVTENREEILKKIEKPELIEKPKEEIHPILVQKLSAPVQAPIVKTEHSPDSIAKPNIPTQASVKPKIPDITVDPYRELPE